MDIIKGWGMKEGVVFGKVEGSKLAVRDFYWFYDTIRKVNTRSDLP
jgi:hypothetical protein